MNNDLLAKWIAIVRMNHDVPAIQAADAELIALLARVAVLEQAVEWADNTLDGNADRRYIQSELRRRAKEG